MASRNLELRVLAKLPIEDAFKFFKLYERVERAGLLEIHKISLDSDNLGCYFTLSIRINVKELLTFEGGAYYKEVYRLLGL